MKPTIAVLLMALVLVAVMPAFGQESVLPPNANRALIEQNLLIGLQTENTGLQRSCALMLGKIHATSAMIPLLTAFHNNPEPGVRMAAAYALCRIGDPVGTYMVRQAVKFDECCKVQLACAWYYENLVQKGTFDFQSPASRLLAEMLDAE